MADTPSNFDPFQELPEPAARADAKEDYARKADALNAALYKLAKRLNVFVAWLNALIAWIVTTRTDMATSQDAAAQSVKDAAGQVKLATDQALASKGSADAAKASSDSAQIFAAAAGAGFGVGVLAGNVGKALVVDPGEKTMSLQDVGLRPGDYLYSAVNPGSSYVPIAGGLTANQAAYPKLFARLGALIDWARNLGTYQYNSTGIYAKNGNTWAAPTGNDDLAFYRSNDGGISWAKFTISGAGGGGNGYVPRQIEFFKGNFFVSLGGQRDRLWAFSDISGTGAVGSPKYFGVAGSYEMYMAQGNGLLVVWHPGQGVTISSDGVNFPYTAIATTAGSLSQYVSYYLFKFAGGYFWACNNVGAIFRSANGKDWTRLAIPSTELVVSGIEVLASGRIVITATGPYTSTAGNVFYYSDNSGQTWSAAISVPFTYRGGMGLFNGQLVCAGTITVSGTTTNILAFSPDGVTWTYYSTPVSARNDFLWWPTQIAGNKLAINGNIVGQHYDPGSQFWIPPLADQSVYIKSYIKVS